MPIQPTLRTHSASIQLDKLNRTSNSAKGHFEKQLQSLVGRNTFTRDWSFETSGQKLLSRTEERFAAIKTYQEYKAIVDQLDGVSQKHLVEHVKPSIVAPINFANRYAKEHPEQIMLNHFSIRGVSAVGDQALLSLLSPSHFLQHPTVKHTIEGSGNATGTHFPISFASPEKLTPQHYSYEGLDYVRVAVYPKTADGRKDHKAAVFGKVALNNGSVATPTSLTLDNPLSQEQLEQAIIRPIATKKLSIKENNEFMLYDYRNNDTVTQQVGSLQEQLGKFFDHEFNDPNGRLNHFTGLATDALRKNNVEWNEYYPTEPNHNRQNVRWERGAERLVETLRDVLGNDRIMTIDSSKVESHFPWAQELASSELESLTFNEDHNFRSWGNIFNQVEFLENRQDSANFPNFNLVMIKLPSLLLQEFGVREVEELSPSQHQEYMRTYRERMTLAFATAQMLGLNFTIGKESRDKLGWDNLKAAPTEIIPKGKDSNWLGEALSPAKALIKDQKNHIDSAEDIKASAMSNHSITSSRRGDDRIISSRPNKMSGSQDNQIHLNGLTFPKGDSVLTFKVKTGAANRFEDPTRWITVKTANEEHSQNIGVTYGKSDNKGYTTIRVYCRNNAQESAIPLEVSAQGKGKMNLRDFKLQAGADIWHREYENGAVISNPSDQVQRVNLEELFGHSDFRHLESNQWDPYLNDLYNGEKTNRWVKIPPLSGLYLQTDK